MRVPRSQWAVEDEHERKRVPPIHHSVTPDFGWTNVGSSIMTSSYGSSCDIINVIATCSSSTIDHINNISKRDETTNNSISRSSSDGFSHSLLVLGVLIDLTCMRCVKTNTIKCERRMKV
jgi:hypothetical protein